MKRQQLFILEAFARKKQSADNLRQLVIPQESTSSISTDHQQSPPLSKSVLPIITEGGASMTLMPCSPPFLTDHATVQHTVLSIARFSAFDSDIARQQDALKSAEGRIRHYLHECHFGRCSCEPLTSTHLLNGISSNSDMSKSGNAAVLDIKSILEQVGSDGGSVVFIIANVDGFMTNIPGFVAFFGPFEDLDLHIVVYGDLVERYPIHEVLDVMRRTQNGEINNLKSVSAASLVDRMVKTGLNKTLFSKSIRQNRAIGVGCGRNTFIDFESVHPIRAAPQSTTPPTFEMSSNVKTAAPIPTNTPTTQPATTIVRASSTTSRTVTEYKTTINNTGKYQCPECDEGFEEIEDLVSHLVDVTMSTGYRPSVYNNTYTMDAAAKSDDDRKCVLCDQVFGRSSGNKKQPVKRHMDKHFPARFPCSGRCGIENCAYLGSSSAELSTHTSIVAPKHECTVCGEKFHWQSRLDLHVEKHVNEYQIIGFASRAGYDVSELVEESIWMSGPLKSVQKLPLSTRLAENAANAVLATRKPEKVKEVAWDGVTTSTGGNNGVNKSTACDACRASGDRCTHRYGIGAPDSARFGVVKSVRCLNCKKVDWKCRHTHVPTPLCENCGINCRYCTHAKAE